MILGVLQTGSGSNSPPGLVLEPILGQPMLGRQLERLGRSKMMDALVVATSVETGAEPILALCEDLQVPCFPGHPSDVLDRVYSAAKALAPRHVVYLTGNCPLIDPAVVDEVIGEHISGGHDYTSNFRRRTYPIGLEAEAIQFTALEEAWREASLAGHREQVTPFVHGQPHRYGLGSVTAGADYSQHRWAADRGEDLELIDRIYQELSGEDPHFSWMDVLALVHRRPELAIKGAP